MFNFLILIFSIFSMFNLNLNCIELNNPNEYLQKMIEVLTGLTDKDPCVGSGRFDLNARENGLDWPSRSYTMVGLKRMRNIQYCAEEVIKNQIPGDFIETGVWRGGAVIFMRAILKAYNITDKQVWVADSFEGLPKPNTEKFPDDAPNDLSGIKVLAVSLDEVKQNFNKFGLLDNQVKFLKGWFKDTLKTPEIKKLAILRLDGDLYESTIQALESLYPKLSVGGYIIIDDFGAVPACKKAVFAYRRKHNITDEVKTIDWTGVYWKKSK